MRVFELLCLVSLAWTLGVVTARSAENYRADWFPFVIPDLADARTAGSPIDLSFLNPGQAGSHGFLRARGEQLVDERGVQVRLFGSNICDYHPMPPKDDAPRIAERLRQLGVNFIRLHYFDWDVAPRGILNSDRQTLNPAKLDQFDFLIANLKRCGIYVDINLHVARGYKDMPRGWHRMGKGLDIIHDPYIESQKRYARELLLHLNPYTKNTYADEPAVAVIEINNENTALRDWWKYAELPERFTAPLRRKWNAWLRAKYRDTAGLKAAWNADPPRGPELLRNGDLSRGTSEWTLQNSGGADSTLSVARDDDGKRLLRWRATKPGTAFWHLQFFQGDVPVRHGRSYVATFRARSAARLSPLKSEPRTVAVSLMQQEQPWKTAGLGAEFRLGAEWRTCTVSWVVDNQAGIPVRLNFTCGNEAGTYDIADLLLREGSAPELREGENLEAGTVELVTRGFGPRRTLDYVSFLVDAELEYARGMRRFVKEDIGAKSLVFDTQVNYGGLSGLVREATAGDAIDCHAYPDHPRRQRDERGTYWSVGNRSMIGRAFGGLEGMALWRLEGKPFFVTEFDLNPPNDHAAETFPMLALFAAYQGWSGIADYSWYNFQRTHGHSRICSHFADTGHAGQMAFVPAAALIFRKGLVAPARKRAVLTVHRGEIVKPLVASPWAGVSGLWKKSGVDGRAAWQLATAVRLAKGAGGATVEGVPLPPAGAMRSDTGQITFDRTEKGREFLLVNAPAARLLIGRVGGRRFEAGDVTFDVGRGTFRPSRASGSFSTSNDDYANIALVAIDGKPVARSRKLLLTVVARVENKGQKWNEDRTSVGRDWGEGPTVAEPVRLKVTLPGSGWRAKALEGTGEPRGDVAVVPAPGGGTLVTDRRHATLWYLIERD